MEYRQVNKTIQYNRTRQCYNNATFGKEILTRYCIGKFIEFYTVGMYCSVLFCIFKFFEVDFTDYVKWKWKWK